MIQAPRIFLKALAGARAPKAWSRRAPPKSQHPRQHPYLPGAHSWGCQTGSGEGDKYR